MTFLALLLRHQGRRPARIFINVDFPTPLGPTRATRSPFSRMRFKSLKTRASAIARGHIREFDDCAAGPRTFGKAEMNRLGFRRDFDLLHALEVLEPALHLGGLGSLVAKFVGECLDARDLLLLRLVRRQQLRQPLLALPEKIRSNSPCKSEPPDSGFREFARTDASRKYRSCETRTRAWG